MKTVKLDAMKAARDAMYEVLLVSCWFGAMRARSDVCSDDERKKELCK